MTVEERMFTLLHRICEWYDEGGETLSGSALLTESDRTIHQQIDDLLDDAVNAGYDFDHNGKGIKKPNG